MERSIDELLNSEQPAPEAAVQPEAQTEVAPETVERPRGPDGKFISKETGVEAEQVPDGITPEPAPPAEQHNQLPPAEYAALKDERRKRQEAEARAAAIEAHYAQLQQQARQQPQQPPVDFWDDPQTFMDSRMNQLGEELFQRFEQRQQAQRLDASEQAARAKYTDYNEAFAAFEQAVRLNPTLAYELAQAPDPGEFAYNRGKTALAIQNVGSVDELKKQIRAELEAEARAAIAPARPSLPSTTAADTSVGARTGPAWSGPKTIGEILG